MPSQPEIIRFARPLKSVDAVTEPVPAEFERRVQQRLRESREAGRAEGEQALHGQLVQQRADLVELQRGVLGSIQETLPKLVRECEGHLVELALEVARKLVAGLPVDQAMVEAAVQDAVGQLEHDCSYTVRLNPEDLALLERMNSGLLASRSADGVRQVSFRASSEVGRGGCLLESPFGVIDSRRETRLEQVRQALHN